MEFGGVAGHHVRSTHDRQAPTTQGVRAEIECPVKLVALHPDKRNQRMCAARAVQALQVFEAGLDVLVDPMHIDVHAVDQ